MPSLRALLAAGLRQDRRRTSALPDDPLAHDISGGGTGVGGRSTPSILDLDDGLDGDFDWAVDPMHAPSSPPSICACLTVWWCA